MLRRELKINFKSFMIWLIIIVAILEMAFLVYPSMIGNSAQLDEFIKTFPEELLKAFNMDIVSIGSVSGWFATEGFLMVSLIGACYASLLGGSILLKEESDKTIEYLYSKPISRNKIITAKLLSGFIYITLFNVLIAILTLVNFSLSNDLNMIRWLLMSIAPLLISYVFYFLSLYISTYFSKVKNMTGISLGLALGTYFLSVIGTMSDKVGFLKFFSPYEYFSSRYIILNDQLHIGYLILSLTIIIVSIIMTYINYNKKELTA